MSSSTKRIVFAGRLLLTSPLSILKRRLTAEREETLGIRREIRPKRRGNRLLRSNVIFLNLSSTSLVPSLGFPSTTTRIPTTLEVPLPSKSISLTNNPFRLSTVWDVAALPSFGLGLNVASGAVVKRSAHRPFRGLSLGGAVRSFQFTKGLTGGDTVEIVLQRLIISSSSSLIRWYLFVVNKES